MQQAVILEELENAAGQLGVRVTYEALQGGLGSGGLCRVRGEYRVIMEKRAHVGERIGTLAQGLAQFPAVMNLQLSEPVRALLRQHTLRRAS